MDLSGKHIAITGASSGIGLVTAKMLAARGAKVSLLARRKEALDDAVAEIGANAAGFPADVGNREALDAALDAAAAKFGPITDLFANAGLTGGFTPFADFDSDVFEETLRVNLTSVFWAIKKVTPAMVEAGKGSILITGSMARKRGMAMNPAYVSSKHGVLGLGRAVAMEFAPHNIRCNTVIPGFIETEALARIPEEQKSGIESRVPQRRMGSSEELAETACFLLSDAASHVTGQDWAVDGGTLNTLEV